MELIISFSILYGIYLNYSDYIKLTKTFKILLLTTLTIPIIGVIMVTIFFIKIQKGMISEYNYLTSPE